MEKVTLREYAKRKKLSYFAVMKMVRNGEIKSETVTEEGKEIPYILLEDEVKKEKIEEAIVEAKSSEMTLEEENMLLKEEIVKLKEALERCNKRTVLA